MSLVNRSTQILLAGASGASLVWSLIVALSDVKKDGKVVDHANVLNPEEFSILSSTFFVFMVLIGARLALHLVNLTKSLMGIQGDEEESRTFTMLRNITSIGALITIMMSSAILRTPSTIHNCPLMGKTEETVSTNSTNSSMVGAPLCDISEQKYDDDMQDQFLSVTMVSAIVAVVLKVSDLVLDFNFDLGRMLEENRKGDTKSWTYLVLVFLSVSLSTASLWISDVRDVRESERYKKNSTLDWVVFLSLVALVAHSALLIVTMISRVQFFKNAGFVLDRMTNMIALGVSAVALLLCILGATINLFGESDDVHRGMILGIILSGIVSALLLLHLIFKSGQRITLDFIAANEIPLLRMVVVLSILSFLSIINGVLVSYQVDYTYASASLALMSLADVLGRNEF